MHCRQKIILLSRIMQRRDSLGESTKIPRLSTGSTLRFKSRRSQSSISSISDVFVCEQSSEGHSDLSVSGMKLRKEKNRDGDEKRDAEARAANVTPIDPFEEGEQTLIRPHHHHREDLGDLARILSRKKPRKLKRPRSVPRSEYERNSCLRGRPNQRPKTIVGERNNRELSKAKRSFKTKYDERMDCTFKLMDCLLDVTVRGWCTRTWTLHLARVRRRARKRCLSRRLDQCRMR